jgi:hypothetical protein
LRDFVAEGGNESSPKRISPHYCQSRQVCVALKNATFPPEERLQLHLLYVLYVCVFWRRETEQLASLSSLSSFHPPPPDTSRQVGFLFFVQPGFQAKTKGET